MITVNWFYLIYYFFENITKQIAFLALPISIKKKQLILCKIYFISHHSYFLSLLQNHLKHF